jgi:hypothetical protein
MNVHSSLTHSVKTIETHGFDVSAIGSLLSGIGTMLGAAAVIFAAIVGTGTFRAWKRQQIIQRQMDIAEQILSIAFRARAAIQAVRSSRESNQELIKAFNETQAFGVDIINSPGPHPSRVQAAFIIMRRLDSYDQIWNELENLKARGWAHFDHSIMTSLNVISYQVDAIREAADAYVNEGLSEEDRIKYGIILKRLSLNEALGKPDTVTLEIAGAVKTIESELKPLITSNADDISRLASQSIKAAVRGAIASIS